MWTPNQVINDGKYIIQGVLGEGGFGITYGAIETSTGDLVAIKTLNRKRQRAKDFPKQQERFVNEAFNLRAFSHLHIVKVYKMIQEDGLWGMVMEFIDGVDLNEYVDEYGQLSEDDALLYIDQIGQALEYIHQQDGMIHRDIKPHNIILRGGKKEAVLVDFGLACNIDQLWVKHSNGRFGFSVQKRIYQSLGGTKKYDDKIWQSFGDKVGWIQRGEWVDYKEYYKNIAFDIKAPLAHLPFGVSLVFGYSLGQMWVSSQSGAFFWQLFPRLQTCRL